MKREMFRAEMLHHELMELEERMAQLDRQHADIAQLQEALATYETLGREEALAPIATGLFVKVNLAGERTFYANVGEGVVVPKTLDEVRADVANHLAQVEEHQAKVHAEFEQKLSELDTLKETFKE